MNEQFFSGFTWYYGDGGPTLKRAHSHNWQVNASVMGRILSPQNSYDEILTPSTSEGDLILE